MNPRQCLVCRGSLTPSQLPGLLACAACGYQGADISLSGEELAALYRVEYFSGGEYSDYLGERATIERNFTRKLSVLLNYVKEPENKHLFEIGAAYGFFLNLARHRFGSVSGIDISADAAAYARTELGVDVVAGDFLVHTPARSIDVACLWDTIEHLGEPDRYLEKLSGLMNQGGIVGLTTGDIGSLLARVRGRHWRQIHPPTHLHYFSRASLTRLLARYGFTVRHTSYDGLYRSLDMIAAIMLTVRRKHTRLYRALKRSGVLNFDLYLNLRDLIFVIAEKTSPISR